MIALLRHLIGWLISACGSRQGLILENLALRQQLLALQAKRPRRRSAVVHKRFWVLLRRLWSGWKTPLILVTPRTVVKWHRAGFRIYWKWLSRVKRMGARKPVSHQVRALIFRMAAENPTWGAPRISRRAAKTGLQVIRANRFAMAAKSTEETRGSQALADVSTKSSRGHCCDGFFHCAHHHLWRPVLFLCNRP